MSPEGKRFTEDFLDCWQQFQTRESTMALDEGVPSKEGRPLIQV